jgi:alpha 1,2-mannosyltransferase
MGVRRYSCFLLQVGVIAYILGAAFYLVGRSTTGTTTSKSFLDSFNSYKSKDLNDIPLDDPNFNNQPDSYTIDPPQYPYKLKVDLPLATNKTERQAAAFIILVRNSELQSMIQSMNDVGKVVIEYWINGRVTNIFFV